VARDRQTHRRRWPIYISPRLRLTRNVTSSYVKNSVGRSVSIRHETVRLRHSARTLRHRLVPGPPRPAAGFTAGRGGHGHWKAAAAATFARHGRRESLRQRSAGTA